LQGILDRGRLELGTYRTEDGVQGREELTGCLGPETVLIHLNTQCLILLHPLLTFGGKAKLLDILAVCHQSLRS
jgi:hypothetical protein